MTPMECNGFLMCPFMVNLICQRKDFPRKKKKKEGTCVSYIFNIKVNTLCVCVCVRGVCIYTHLYNEWKRNEEKKSQVTFSFYFVLSISPSHLFLSIIKCQVTNANINKAISEAY